MLFLIRLLSVMPFLILKSPVIIACSFNSQYFGVPISYLYPSEGGKIPNNARPLLVFSRSSHATSWQEYPEHYGPCFPKAFNIAKDGENVPSALYASWPYSSINPLLYSLCGIGSDIEYNQTNPNMSSNQCPKNGKKSHICYILQIVPEDDLESDMDYTLSFEYYHNDTEYYGCSAIPTSESLIKFSTSGLSDIEPPVFNGVYELKLESSPYKYFYGIMSDCKCNFESFNYIFQDSLTIVLNKIDDNDQEQPLIVNYSIMLVSGEKKTDIANFWQIVPQEQKDSKPSFKLLLNSWGRYGDNYCFTIKVFDISWNWTGSSGEDCVQITHPNKPELAEEFSDDVSEALSEAGDLEYYDEIFEMTEKADDSSETKKHSGCGCRFNASKADFYSYLNILIILIFSLLVLFRLKAFPNNFQKN
ncbi:MAG: hypothetical protein FJ088_00555 [Deltaproteobacteria bacterium]|nr:hypothetical protein [Deltaproteobacteria bacterium]